MPNIKSAIKRVEIEKRNNEINKAKRTEIATFIKKFKKAVNEKQIEQAETLYRQVSGILDSAVNENIIHANKADRKKASLAKLLDNCKKA